MRKVISTITALSALALAGCPSGDGPCKDVACSGHGTCRVQDGQAVCSCDEGYEPDGLDCRACSTTGQACEWDPDCCTGFCFSDYHLVESYCSPPSCLGDEDCQDTSDPPSAMCCVQDPTGSGYCQKLPEGQACGNQDVACGGYCDDQGDSACLPGSTCFYTGCHFQCLKSCEDQSQCRSCSEPDFPDAAFLCMAFSEGQLFCDIYDRYYSCSGRSDCCELHDEACIPWPTADEQGFEGRCNKLGEKPTGAACDEDVDPNDLPPEERCVGWYCLRDHCSELCTHDSDCPAGMVCGEWTFQMDDAATVFSQIGMCRWMPGSQDPCSSDADCPDGEVCDHYLPPDGPATKACTTRRCDPPADGCAGFGQACGPGLARCASWLCLIEPPADQGVCSSLCDQDPDCPAGATCQEHTLPGFEQPVRVCR